MRLDVWLWLAGGALVLIAGLLRLLLRTDENPGREPLHSTASPAGRGLWAPLVLSCLGLAFILAGLAWRAWLSGTWPGSAPADRVAMLAAGTLAILSWILLVEIRRVRAAKSRFPNSPAPGGVDLGGAGLDGDGAVAEALALFGASLLVLAAIGAAWWSPLPESSPHARSWAFGLQVIAASLGLGAWLPAFTAESSALGRDAARGLRLWKRAAEPGPMSAAPGPEAMRTAYPWLTAACLLSAAWSMATVAALWRGLSPEAWLMAAWLLGGIYLIAALDQPPVRLPRWTLALLTACGAAAAVLQAWQTPLLLP